MNSFEQIEAPRPEGGGLIQTFHEYVLENSGFVCNFAEQFLRAGRVTTLVLPEAESQKDVPGSSLAGDIPRLENIDALQDSLSEGLGDFLAGDSDAVIYLDPCIPTTHEGAFGKTWGIYAELGVALLCLEDLAAAKEQVRPVMWQIASELAPPEQIEQYLDGGLLGYQGQPFYLISMNSLYTTSPRPHPRYAPVTAYVLTRQSDVMGALEHASEVAQLVRDKMDASPGLPYSGSLPYVFENDDRFVPEDYRALFGMISKIEAQVRPHMTGDLVEMTCIVRHDLLAEALRSGKTRDQKLNAVFNQRKVLEILERHGFLTVSLDSLFELD